MAKSPVDDVLLSSGRRRQEQRTKADFVQAFDGSSSRTDFGDDSILAEQRDDIGERAQGGDLDEARQEIFATSSPAQCLHQLQRHADTGKRLVGVGAIPALRIDHGHSAGGSSASGS